MLTKTASSRAPAQPVPKVRSLSAGPLRVPASGRRPAGGTSVALPRPSRARDRPSGPGPIQPWFTAAAAGRGGTSRRMRGAGHAADGLKRSEPARNARAARIQLDNRTLHVRQAERTRRPAAHGGEQGLRRPRRLAAPPADGRCTAQDRGARKAAGCFSASASMCRRARGTPTPCGPPLSAREAMPAPPRSGPPTPGQPDGAPLPRIMRTRRWRRRTHDPGDAFMRRPTAAGAATGVEQGLRAASRLRHVALAARGGRSRRSESALRRPRPAHGGRVEQAGSRGMHDLDRSDDSDAGPTRTRRRLPGPAGAVHRSRPHKTGAPVHAPRLYGPRPPPPGRKRLTAHRAGRGARRPPRPWPS